MTTQQAVADRSLQTLAVPLSYPLGDVERGWLDAAEGTENEEGTD